MFNLIARSAEHKLAALLRTFPAVLLSGPRQCGKSTLSKAFLPHWQHLDLERPADVNLIAADIEGFLGANPAGVVFDEAQRLPELFPVLRYVLDRSPKKGRYLLLGSAGPALIKTSSETLAGRLGVLELTPFTGAELVGSKAAKGRWFWGGLPPVHRLKSGTARADWLDAYVTLFLERDLPALGLRLPAQRLRILWTMLTHVHGRELNVADLARSLGVSSHTVATHIDVLESAFMVRRLFPYHANLQKRLSKSPKIYVRDTGLLHFLAGLREPKELDTWDRLGSSFEGLVIEELAALARERLTRPELYHWRTAAGGEVDLVIVDGRRITPIEIKLGTAPDLRSLRGLRQCMQDLSLKRGWVVYGGAERRRMSDGIELVPWASVVDRSETFGF